VLEARLAVRFQGAFFDRNETGLRALLPVTVAGEAEARAWVREAHAAVSTQDRPVAIGLSEVCTGRPGYVAGFEEAALAVSAAAVLQARPSVMAFDELGPYKYLLRLPRGTRDRHCDRLRPLLDYDRDHGSQLFLTLEEYFRRRGRVAATAASLYIHPNTLRQRLGRIAALTGIDVEREDPLTLELAMKLVRLDDGLARGA
jgi:DNA-binding PucR family transcriptional regulator